MYSLLTVTIRNNMIIGCITAYKIASISPTPTSV